MSSNVTLPTYITESVDDIHNRMIEAAPSNVNTIEGDIFWDNTRPIAEEIAKFKNIALKNLIYSRFPQTALDEDLDLCGEDDGVSRKSADYAIQKIKFTGAEGTIIEKGRIVCTVATEENTSVEFAINEDTSIRESEETTVNAICTVPGAIGNVALGNIKILAKSLDGISSVENIEMVKLGVDKESNENYSSRILEKAQKPITSGNKNHYEAWAKEVTGVGDAKCFPLWNGRGTVKVVIVDTNKKGATTQLIQDTYNYIDSVRPVISGTLTVVSATEKAINITANISLATGYTIDNVKENFNLLLDKYLKEIAFKVTYISIAKIGNILLSTEGILDYSGLTLNNGTGNLQLADEDIAILGTTTFSEVV